MDSRFMNGDVIYESTMERNQELFLYDLKDSPYRMHPSMRIT